MRLEDLAAVIAAPATRDADLGEDLAQAAPGPWRHGCLGGARIEAWQLAALHQRLVLGMVEPVAGGCSQVSQGQTAAGATKPIRQARWWVLQHWPVCRTRRPADAAPRRQEGWLVNRSNRKSNGGNVGGLSGCQNAGQDALGTSWSALERFR